MAVTERIFTCNLMEEIWCMFQLFNNDNMGKISIRSLWRVAKEIGDGLEDNKLYVFPSLWFLGVLLIDTVGCLDK